MKRKLFYLVAAVIMIVSSYFTRLYIQNEEYSYITALAIVLLAIPSYYFFYRSVGIKSAFIVIGLLSIFAIGIETIGILTGFPYGSFAYADSIPGKLFGHTPWTVAFAWTPLVIGAATFVKRISNSSILKQTLVSTAFLILFDLILDPGAVAIGMWEYGKNGAYYGVPLMNFFGWALSGAIGSFIVFKLTKGKELLIDCASSIMLQTFFWTGVAFALSLTVPFGIGMLYIVCFSFFVMNLI